MHGAVLMRDDSLHLHRTEETELHLHVSNSSEQLKHVTLLINCVTDQPFDDEAVINDACQALVRAVIK